MINVGMASAREICELMGEADISSEMTACISSVPGESAGLLYVHMGQIQVLTWERASERAFQSKSCV